jgi:hemerythrin-like metal-binding protein
MALLTWGHGYSVEVASIDKQHQVLFDLLNSLNDAMTAGTGNQKAPAILMNLLRYTREHFSYEEGLMLQAHYPHLAQHKAEHDKLTGDAVSLVRDLEQRKAPITTKLLEFLRNWLESHIHGSDKQYSVYMQRAGIR